MCLRTCLGCIILTAGAGAGWGFNGEPAGNEGGGLAALSWMTGLWQSLEDGALIEEHWSTPHGNCMIGMVRVVRDGRLRMAEMLLIEETDQGIVLTLKHFGRSLEDRDQGRVFSFHLIRAAENETVFEHPDPDFAGRRRIIYRRDGDSMTARLEDDRPDKAATDIVMNRRSE